MSPNFNKHSEEAFLFASVSEFVKCWSSGKKSRLILESVNGYSFVNFSAFLGYPGDHHFNANGRHRNPKAQNSKKKSSHQIQSDNERAARFQERKRREMAMTSSPAGIPTSLASSPSAAAPANFTFSEPHPENLRENLLERTALCVSELHENQEHDDPASVSLTSIAEEGIPEQTSKLVLEGSKGPLDPPTETKETQTLSISVKHKATSTATTSLLRESQTT